MTPSSTPSATERASGPLDVSGAGRNAAAPSATFVFSRSLIVRGVGLCALIAFTSLLVQVRGLVGESGILPAQEFFERVARHFENDAGAVDGVACFTHVPSLFWITGATNAWLIAFCIAGMLASLSAIADRLALPALLSCYALYLSLCGAGQIFLGYQWDMLLCEALVVAALNAPGRKTGRPSLFALGVAWLLAARLEMGSGLSKLVSGDETWRSLTALEYHFETQPLPTELGVLAHHLPHALLDAACLIMFAIQLVAPLLLFVPVVGAGSWARRVRHAGVAALTLLQLGIAATGNYTFFNLLSAILAASALDDDAWRAVARLISRGRIALDAAPTTTTTPETAPGPKAATAAAPGPKAAMATAAIACVLALLGVGAQLSRLTREPLFFDDVLAAVEPFQIAGGYGLFANMTTERDEIEVEATKDGVTWLPYAFAHKPGDVDRWPDVTAPHQPRLDWQMWFAALGSARQNPWFLHFLDRLREADPDVLALLDDDPMHGDKPLAVRATFYRYHFAPLGSGHVWTREEIGTYAPAR